ncbi:MAG: hypothetical protein R3312_07000 [Gammaproteobacteria bacterium]|nr:hypothetical protein [Gammaproteobacteria bacterium]
MHIPNFFKESIVLSTLVIGYGAFCGVWAFSLLLIVELLFGPLEQDGIVFQLTIVIGIMSYVLFIPRVATKLNDMWEMHKLKK